MVKVLIKFTFVGFSICNKRHNGCYNCQDKIKFLYSRNTRNTTKYKLITIQS